MKFEKVNLVILILAAISCIAETAHYGWNMSPHSDGEMICDGISFLICALAFVGAWEVK